MQNMIAGLLAVLGTLLVLAGGTITVLKTLGPNTSEAPSSPSRIVNWARKLNGADRLIAWGVVVLLLAAIAAGAISFNLGASAGSR